jgi:hypothetical protein
MRNSAITENPKVNLPTIRASRRELVLDVKPDF